MLIQLYQGLIIAFKRNKIKKVEEDLYIYKIKKVAEDLYIYKIKWCVMLISFTSYFPDRSLKKIKNYQCNILEYIILPCRKYLTQTVGYLNQTVITLNKI